ncbi:amino acid adenylation domain-containing protein [Streptomyces sp. NPDC001858]
MGTNHENTQPQDDPERAAALRRALLRKRLQGQAGASRAIGRRTGTGPPPLSPAQHGMWVIDHFLPDNSVYGIDQVIRLRGRVDRDALGLAVADLTDRHEALRTTFAGVDEPYQVIRPRWTGRLEVRDVHTLPSAQRKEAADRLVARERGRPFDLRQGPLFRALLVVVGPSESLLVLTMHHMVADGWSVGLIAADLSVLYRSRLTGGPAPAPVVLQYGDCAQWQADLRKAGRTAEQLDHWRAELRDVPAVLDLPVNHERPPQLSHRGHNAHRTLTPELSRAVRRLAERHGITLFTLLLSAFDLLLGRWSGQQRFAVGAAVSGRTTTEAESVVGLFANTVAIPADLTGAPSFLELATRVNAAVLGALDHQDVAFEEVVAALGLPRDPARNPVYQVLFQCTEAGGDRWDLPGLEAEHVIGDTPSAKVDLLLSAVHGPETVELELVCEADLFEAATGHRLLGHLVTVLEQVTADPALPVADVALLSAAEQTVITQEWNDTFRPCPADSTVPELFARTCARVPDATALVAGTETMTYAELDAASSRLARLLQSRGVRADEPVAVAVPRSISLVVALLAVLKAGAAYLVLDSANPAERNRALLADSEAGLLLVTGAPETEAVPAPDGVDVIDLDDPGTAAELAALPATAPGCPATPHSLAYISYTSGSTGRPKGVMIPHQGVVRLVHEPVYAQLGEGQTLLQLAPVAFDASTMELWGSLLTGAELVVAPPGRLGVAEIGALLLEHRVTVVFLTTGLFHQMAEYGLDSFAHLRYLLTGGDVLSPDAMRASLNAHDGLTVVACYGPTENTTYTTCRPMTDPGQVGARVTLGRPLQQTTVYVLDEQLKPVPVGTPGELYTGGDGVARGYLGRPALTAERFLPDPFSSTPGARMYASGDLVRYRPDGLLDFIGRIDGQVKIRGFRIEPGEIEARLLTHPGIAQTAVNVVEAVPGHKALVAYTAPVGPSAAELRAHLRQVLPEYMVPQAFVSLDTLPLRANGKVDRRLLPAPAPEQAADAGDGAAQPRTPAEHVLSDVWSRVLQQDGIGVHDNFFELGGDSILAIRVVAEAAKAGLRTAPRQLFEHQTIAALAAAIDEHADAPGASAAPAAEQGTVSGAVELTPVHRWFTELDWPHHHHNQSVRLAWTPGPDAELLGSALRALTAHHDALRLRLRLVHGAPGGWQEHIAEREDGDLLRVVDLSRTPAADRERVVEEEANRAHAALDLVRGPIMRAVLFRGGADAEDQLFWTIHHIAVDTVSWNVLLEDLGTAYRSLTAGQEPVLPPKTTSFRAWADRLTAHAASEEFAAEAAFWEDAAQDAEQLPTDFTHGANTEETSADLVTVLPEAETAALIRAVPAAYRTRINDVLLTALARTLCGWTGSRTASVSLEGHGREPLFDEVDLTRTVGWFTTIRPVHLWLPEHDDPAGDLKAVKEHLRRFPRNGIGYGLARYLRPDTREALGRRADPQVSFNYHGRIAGSQQGEEETAEPALRRLAAVGSEGAAAGVRPHLLDVNAAVIEGALRVRWTYSTEVHRSETVQRLAEDFLDQLRTLIDHCASGAAGATPSDFPLAGLDQGALDKLLAGLDARQIEDVYPLTPLQTGLLSHTLQRPDRADYVTQLSWRIEGELDARAFLDAWQHVVDRHAILRTTFTWDDVPEPLQVVHRRFPLQIEQADWSGTPEQIDGRFADLLAAERAKGFDLEHAPAHRFHLLRTGARSQLLVWHNHHILLDGWSVALVLEEVFACYEAIHGEGRPPKLPEPASYRSHIAWLRQQDREAARAHWRSAVEGVTGPTPVPVVATAKTGAGAATTRPQRLADDVTAAVGRLARENKITVNTVLQAAWALTLARYSGESDVLFGNTATERMSGVPGADRMIGLLINTLPTRVRVDESLPVGRWLREVHPQLTEIQRHGHLSVSEIQRFTSVPGGQRLFDSILVFTDTRGVGGRPAGALEVVPSAGHEQPGYPLMVRADLADDLVLTLNYERGLVDPDAAARLLGHYAGLLEQLAAAPDTAALRDLPMLSAEELRELAAGGATAEPAPTGGTLVDLVEDQVRAVPEAVALTADGISLTYAQLDADANRLAHRLRACGVRAGNLVAVHLEPSAETVVALLAVLKAGAAYLPLDPAYPVERRKFVLEDSGAVLVLTHGALPAVADCAVPAVRLDEPWEDLDAPDPEPLPRATLRDLAYTIYTSGSTGRPKGVGIEHRSIVHLLCAARDLLGASREHSWLNLTTISFDIAAVEIFLPLITGARVVVAPPGTSADPDAAAALIRAERPTHIQATPSGWRVLLTGGFHDPSAVAVSVGEPLPPALAQDLASRCLRLWNAYGPSETAVWSTAEPLSGPVAEVTIGRPLAGERVHVLDAGLRPVPVGVPGELLIGGPGVGRGYLGRPGLTAERFVPDPYGAPGERLYRTGDRVRLLPDGRLDFLGRMDRQTKVRGHRVELEEIEARLDEHPGVRQSIVVVSESGAGMSHLAAYVVPREGRAPDETELRSHLTRLLPNHMVPHMFVTVEKLPVTPNGKIDRNVLHALERDRATDERPFVAPRTLAETVLAAAWAEVLEVARVSVQDDVFELGGDSIRSLQVMTRARAAGLQVTVSQITRHRTVAATAAAADRSSPAAPMLTVGTFLDRLRPDGEELVEVLGRHRVPGVGAAVVRNGRLQAIWADGEIHRGQPARLTDSTLFQAGSVAKHVTALLALLMVQEGLLDLDQDVNRYLDRWQVPGAPGHGAPSLRALLSHTAGLEVAPGRAFDPEGPMPSLEELLGGKPERPPVLRTDAVHIGRYRYANTGYSVVQQVLENVGGKPLEDLARERLFTPLGLHGTVFSARPPADRHTVAVGHDRRGLPLPGRWRVTPELAGAGLWSTPRDLAVLEAEIWRAAVGEDPVLLGTDLAKAMIHPVAQGVYGLGTMLRDTAGAKWFGHIGEPTGARSFSFLDAEDGSGFVLMLNSESATAAVRDLLGRLRFAEELAV